MELKKKWGKSYKPVRKFVLWGWDDNENPSIVVLFGFHNFKTSIRITN